MDYPRRRHRSNVSFSMAGARYLNFKFFPFTRLRCCVPFSDRWIESLNTVMDDNKILTLASNERIALTPTMRLIFEISNLRTATPATVAKHFK